ncbi:uncharacterized protein TNCV_4845631 [Trichonephila clavipes]|uniref:Transposase n=1 Tax=Trichonephila clavipes TaxID=2585209 RepID=A0A8X6WM10_TRICX|nr:uncharacterized protein TNCV_4845631 [Trichonephila clavipes]
MLTRCGSERVLLTPELPYITNPILYGFHYCTCLDRIPCQPMEDLRSQQSDENPDVILGSGAPKALGFFPLDYNSKYIVPAIAPEELPINISDLRAEYRKMGSAFLHFVGYVQHGKVIFDDEAHFWLNGYVNKQNCRIWSEANPQVYVETPLHPEKHCLVRFMGWWNPSSKTMKATTLQSMVIGRAMITNFFIPELNNHEVQELWFQQDGATCHTARATIDLLKDTFGDRLISRFGPVNWPPRSCDLTPLDYFLWGYVKSLVYADKPQTLDHLEDNIRRVIADIRPQMLEKVIENWTSRLDYIRASRGSPMPEIIFKM